MLCCNPGGSGQLLCRAPALPAAWHQPNPSAAAGNDSQAGLQTATAGAAPRASDAEVTQLLGQLPKALTARVAAAYKEYVPFQQYIEGPFLVILHIAKALPSQINTAAAAASSSSSSSSSSLPYQVAYGGFSAADADAASTLVTNSSLLSKLRRNLYFGWRSDELLDRHQDDLNQVMHVLSRRLMLLPVQQSPDIDILLPSHKAALLLDDDLSPPPAAAPSTSSSSSPSKHHQHYQQQQPAAAALSSNAYLAACHDALSVLLRNRYAAPPGGFHAKSTPGIRAAKARCLQQRGWQVVHVALSEVEACMGGPSAGAGQRRKPRDLAAGHAALEALLRARLKGV
ncbi:hypothetical protein OEZ85_005405 [Tetradesmus obliquus]|uniref:Uncharacterized protein n=1 Tax=Tetradesmus obliquus TaxID=3088 RepID=A0ABY8UIA2_TETOB|nr:hypothetical protein OEZ85_005405 [Tetradesmus obliquus]